ncbi:MAG: FtsX-like permease family protein [Planctomycetota bacterium]
MYKLVLSLRYFRSRFLTIASLLAIMFGVAMLVIVLSVMGGYLVTLEKNLRGQESDLQITGPGLEQYGVQDIDGIEEVLEGMPQVNGYAPFIERLCVYHSGYSFRPFVLKAVDPVAQMAVSDLEHFTLRHDELSQLLGDPGEYCRKGPRDASDTSDAKIASDLDRLIKDPNRAPLSEDEIEQLFSLEWRRKMLGDGEDGATRLEEFGDDIPAGALVGMQLLIDREICLGDVITIVTMNPDPSNQIPLDLDLVVVGAIKTGDFEQDSGAIHAELSVVKNWLPLYNEQTNKVRYQGVRVSLTPTSDDLLKSRFEVEKEIRRAYPTRGYRVRTWRDLRRNLLRAVLIEKYLVYFLVLILVVFTGSMILLMLLLTVIEKTRDVGVLLSLGATPGGVSSIFLVNGLVICVVGTALGLGLGVGFCQYINDIHDAIYEVTGKKLFDPEIYHMDRIPVAFKPFDLFLSTVPPVLIGFLASWVPALWAPRRDPIKAIQYD